MSFMNKFTALASLGESSKKENHRAHGRANADAVDCDRGQVLDLSRTGMRLQSWRPWNEGERRTIMLTGVHVGVTLTAKCVWVKKVSRFKHIMGLHFEGLNEATSTVIRELMHVAAPNVHDGWASHKTEVDSIMDDMKAIDEHSRRSA
ncbi:MAG: PilZ domain-containing protein [Phycisphaeraceae bacterium]|nr:PilZ domain-containing protein [Phycisphaeraceae bacterium]MCB9847081.1 PilZ domain-containing protein [Phycisphaeraceae bacterium]